MAKWQQIEQELESGRTISQYPTGSIGYDSKYRWDDTKEVIALKTIMALQKRRIIDILPISTIIIK